MCSHLFSFILKKINDEEMFIYQIPTSSTEIYMNFFQTFLCHFHVEVSKLSQQDHVMSKHMAKNLNEDIV